VTAASSSDLTVGFSTSFSFRSLAPGRAREVEASACLYDRAETPFDCALWERRERENPSRLLIDQALAPLDTVAAASQGLSLRRS